MSQPEWENLASLVSLLVAAVALVLLWLRLIPAKWIDLIEAAFAKLARTRALCFVLVPAMSFSVNLIIAARHGIPHPIIHDEFSYLLAADTFAHGRLTNPTPPFVEHFETPHELMRPTYMSKYPPGQGLALAAGQISSGEPIVGVWFAAALATVAMYWMLLGFVPPTWALCGSVVAALHPQLVDWCRVYWGGSVALLGGAMVLGAWGRLMVRSSVPASVVLGMGWVVLANSRPYEGFVVCVPLIIALLPVLTGRISSETGAWAMILPAAVVLMLGAAWMGYYNFRITGHVLRMPFVEYARQYDVYPKFWFLPTRPEPIYHNDTLRFVHTDFERGLYDDLRTFGGFIRISCYRARELVETNQKLAVLYLPLMVGIFGWRQRQVKWLLITVAICLLGLWAENFVLPHYEAPVTPIFIVLTVLGWQRLRDWNWRSRPVGQWLARAIALGFLAGAVMADAQPLSPEPLYVEQQRFVDAEPVLAGGRHLIFVHYAPMHSLHNEYVFNHADLDSSRLIWARSFGPEADLPVAEHFKGRQVWLLNVGGKLDLQPYLR